MKKVYWTIIINLLMGNYIYSQGTVSSTNSKRGVNNSGQIKWTTNPFDRQVFIQNNGQFDGSINSGEKVLYGVQLGKVHIYFTQNKLIYRYDEITLKQKVDPNADPDDAKNFKHKTYFLKAEWKGANKSAYIEGKDEQKNYYTYGMDSNKTIKANIFKRIIYKNLYPGIDAIYQFEKGKDGIKYSLIVHPGADLSQIKITYSGAKAITKNNNGDIIISSGLNLLTDHSPQAYYSGELINVPFSNGDCLILS